MGTYDLLKDPTVITPGWKYVCYTNNKDLKSDVWEIFYMNLQDVKQVRKVKIITPFEYDICIWVDASIEIQCNLDDFVRDYHSTYFTIMRHPYRNCTYMEAEACIQRRKDNADVIKQQMEYYRQQRLPHNSGMVASGLIIRNNCKQVKDFCEKWWSEVSNFSRRDQLSFNYTLYKNPIKLTLIPYEVLTKEFFLYLHHNSKIP